MKNRGFEIKKKENKIKLWKGIWWMILLVPFLSFFSISTKIVYAEKKNVLDWVYSGGLDLFYKKSFPYYIGKIFHDYQLNKNILKEDKPQILLLLNKADLLSQVFKLDKKNITFFVDTIKKYYNDIFNLLGEKGKKIYLVILENTSEERPDGGFFGSFIKASLLSGYLVNFQIYDSYYLLWKYCKEHTSNLSNQNWFETCNKSGLSLKNKIEPFNRIFPTTTFITSNIFGFTKLNAENIVKHYNKVFSDKIDGVIFIKSDILKYLLPDGEKIRWEMEYLNWKSKRFKNNLKKIGKNEKNQVILSGFILKGLNGKKKDYLLFVNNILSGKKQIIIANFVNNFDKIQKQGFIRAYFFGVSNKFNKFLQKNNFQLTWNKNQSYLFFYNLGFNKNSKFVDHLVNIDGKIYLNLTKFYLQPGIHKIHIKNVFRLNPFYKEFLIKKQVPKTSYLWSDLLKYKHLLVLQNNCQVLNYQKNFYEIVCR